MDADNRSKSSQERERHIKSRVAACSGVEQEATEERSKE